jgi:hypothetical protein
MLALSGKMIVITDNLEIGQKCVILNLTCLEYGTALIKGWLVENTIEKKRITHFCFLFLQTPSEAPGSGLLLLLLLL